jgi:hypothetical protein
MTTAVETSIYISTKPSCELTARIILSVQYVSFRKASKLFQAFSSSIRNWADATRHSRWLGGNDNNMDVEETYFAWV